MIRTNLARRSAAVLLSALVLQAGGLPYFSTWAQAAEEESPKVVVLPVSFGANVPEKAPTRFRELLSEELKSRDSLSVVDLPKGKAPKSSAASSEGAAKVSKTPPAEALSALESGQQALTDLKFDDAAESLKKGIDLMAAHPEGIDFEKMVDAYISLAVASFRQGDEDAAQKALLSVVRIAPDYKLPDGKFPPIFVRELEKAHRRSEKAIKGTISIEGPAGATAFIDGKDLGMLPVIQENLIAGQHFVKVEGTRGELFGQAVEVKNGVSKVTAKLQSAGGGSASNAPVKMAGVIGPTLDNDAVSQAATAIDSMGADFAVVGTLYRSGEHQLTAATALFSARAHGFAVLKTYTFDEELLTANVEAYKLADDISDAMGQFPRAASLPVNLAAGAEKYKPSTAVASRTGDADVSSGSKRTALTQSKDKPTVTDSDEHEGELLPEPIKIAKKNPRPTTDDEETSQNAVHAINGGSMAGDKARTIDDERGGGEVHSGGVPWWVWTVVGVGVVGAAGGTYFGISQATRPVTGTVTARW